MSDFDQVDLELLKKADLDNDEVLELVFLYARTEDPGPYSEHLKVLRAKYNPSLEAYPFEIELFKHRDQIEPEGYRNIFVGLEDVGYEPLFYDLLSYFQLDPDAGLYLRIVHDIYGEPDEEFCQQALRYINEPGEDQKSVPGRTPGRNRWEPIPDRQSLSQDNPEFCKDFLGGQGEECENFIDRAEETEQRLEGPGVNAISQYLIQRIAEISEYAEIPKYIGQYEIGDLPTIKLDKISNQLSVREIATHLIEQTENYGLILVQEDQNDPREAAIEKLSVDLGSMPLSDLNKYLAAFRVTKSQILEIQKNENLFRVFGPVNPHPDEDYSDLQVWDEETEEYILDLEKIYGGPRMLISMEYERDLDRDLESSDWFVGYCLQCLKRIRKRHYAIRRALIQGGWLGCYCSDQCVRASLILGLGDSNINPNSPEDNEILKLELALNAEFWELLNKIGIVEREGGEVERTIWNPEPYDSDLIARLPDLSEPLPSSIITDITDLLLED